MSARWDPKSLLEPIAADQPCGQNLEDTQLMASFDAFRVFGQSTPLTPTSSDPNERARPEPDWVAIRTQALDALSKSKDLRLLAFLGTAVLRTDGLGVFSDVLGIAAGWLERYWDQTYPLVDEDAILRRSALNCFADQMAVVDAVRRRPLVASRQHGTFTLRDLDIVAGVLQPTNGEPRPEEAQINAAFAAVPLEQLKLEQLSVADALAALKRIDATMSGHAGSEAVPDFQSLSSQLSKIDRALRAQLSTRNGGEEAGAAEGEPEPGGAAVMAVGAIRSRSDAIRALDAVAEFFRRNEPSSPIPLFLERAKRLVSKDFLEVLADIAPDALPQARAAGGVAQIE